VTFDGNGPRFLWSFPHAKTSSRQTCKVANMALPQRPCSRCGENFSPPASVLNPLYVHTGGRADSWCSECIDELEDSDKPKCPACLGLVKRKASKCVNCGSDLPKESFIVDFEWDTDYSLEKQREEEAKKEGKKDRRSTYAVACFLILIFFIYLDTQ
jgi:hypothetical protein